jgi:prepilin signal peptidase PulO-like enzyme (type II secretory pathway)
MIIAILIVLGLLFGSFVNALVWRVRQQELAYKKSKVRKDKKSLKPITINFTDFKLFTDNKYSILTGRSMCPHCHHELSSADLVPVLSWLWLRGKCRYCQKPISWQYPVVELSTMILFVGSYLVWPYGWNLSGTINFGVWLVLLTGFMALIVYDFRWMLLPNRIVYPLTVLAAAMALFNIVHTGAWVTILDIILSVLIAGGIFYSLFVVSKGKWIGGGDIKLGVLLGLLVADPLKAFMVLFGASLVGTMIILPGLATKKLTSQSLIPFGPFLILSGIIVYLFGTPILDWYKELILLEVK